MTLENVFNESVQLILRIYDACDIHQSLTWELMLKFWNQAHNNMWTLTRKNCVCKDHIVLQLKLKNHSSTNVLQLRLSKCNSYATTFYKYGDLINKFSHQKIN
jgi:hypothetical protein